MTYYYSIFDVTKPIFDANKEIQCDKPKKAVELYLRGIGEQFKNIVVDGTNYARIKAEPFYIKDGTKYRSGKKRSMWFSVQH
jgi:hypothetical protein